MRNIEIRTVDEDIKALYVDDEYTGLVYTKDEINAMLDDLIATQASSSNIARSRSELLTELVTKSLASCYSDYPLDGGPLTPDELKEAARIVGKSCKKGWFS